MRLFTQIKASQTMGIINKVVIKKEINAKRFSSRQ